MREATNTTTALLTSCVLVGQEPYKQAPIRLLDIRKQFIKYFHFLNS